ncbi:hypothetical protein [Paenibacillus sp. S150]|nr:hypothetical protein [Paenibacillus sp. S150]MBW4084163.1 hypothetical protein [Paenibacillus sp. S150]
MWSNAIAIDNAADKIRHTIGRQYPARQPAVRKKKRLPEKIIPRQLLQVL